MKSIGKVTLIGAGCGRGLITVRGLQALREAEVVLCDDLIDRALLSELREDCEVIYVGKRSGRPSEKQERIHELLIEKAREGRRVVRLKGGDSFVFGRGKEEILALDEAGILSEVIPGVTSAVAVPERFGIPVTHRGEAQSFTVVTGRTAGEADEDYAALAGLRGTLVFLMPLGRLKSICERLTDNGKPGNTPASVLSAAYSANETRIDGTLADIAEKAKDAAAPAILVVGSTAAYRNRQGESLPLHGVRVTVTGTAEFSSKLEGKLTAAGARVDAIPTIRTVPLEPIPDDFSAYAWLAFTSSVGVRMFFGELRRDLRVLCHLKFACVGPGTAQTLRQFGFTADLIPKTYTAKSLGEELAALPGNKEKILILRAEDGSPEMTDALSAAEIVFDDIPLYRAQAIPTRIESDADYLVLASAAGVRAFYENGSRIGLERVICIGEAAAEEYKKHGGDPVLIPENHTADGIVTLIRNDILRRVTP